MSREELAGCSDEELVRRIEEGGDLNPPAEELVSRLRLMVFACITQHLHNPVEYDDAFQLCWMRAFSHLQQFDPRVAAFSTWLWRVSRSVCLNMNRRRLRQARAEALFAQDCACAEGMDERRARVVRHRLWRLLARLPLRERSPLVRHFIDGRSYAELARTFGESERRLRYRALAGLARLRALARQEGSDINERSISA